ncbi:MAG TPA: preprotein translocase subunit SecA [Candidatus Binatia bacterium]|nr:preprotein translocase subunit SecA [Candidatus Binatia bacterium]
MNTPTQAYRRLQFHPPDRLLKGLDARVNALVGLYQRRGDVLSRLRRQALQIDAQAADWVALHDYQLHQRLLEFRDRFRRGGQHLDEVLVPTLAAIREAADRKLGLRPFTVQLMGALALHRGYLAEMATGEGKTLTAGLAAVLAAWTNRPCHVVTVNDYLVERDAQWMRPLYEFCAVRTGWVTAPMGPADRRKGYAADVTYVTSKELLADFLRDRLRLGTVTDPARRLLRELVRPRSSAGDDGVVMRGLHSAIIDEADSVLIDEAVTPLIISAPHKNSLLESAVTAASQIAAALELNADYRLNHRYREVEFSPAGRAKLDSLCQDLPGLWRGTERRGELIRQALVAREFFLRDKQYIIADGKVVIVDEFTGRQMPQRTWRQGLHQAIEAKEGLALSDPSETIARLSFQRFFRCFHRLAGMTGTAREAAFEFWQIYKLPVVAIPTNKPCIREHWPDRVFLDEAAKWQAVAEDVARVQSAGRPVLVGTRSVVASEKLASLLAGKGLECQVLNAVRHQDEAALVAVAGESGRITIATNMAGRGTDIKLGQGVTRLGGLHVLATERHESTRVDWQLFGRAARQGDPGSAQAFVSTEDELVRRYLPGTVSNALRRAVQTRMSAWQKLAHGAFALAQRRAQKQAFRQRQSILQADTWLDESLSFAGSDVV